MGAIKDIGNMKNTNKFISEGLTEEATAMITGMPMSPLPCAKHDCVVFSTGGGGIGKIIQSTAILNDIIKCYGKYTDIHVITPHVEIFKGNERIHKVWHIGGTHGLYELLNNTYKNIKWLQYEPYHNAEYISGDKHIIDAWRDGMNFPPKITQGREYNLEINLNKKEIEEGQDIITHNKGPVILFQITGGAVKVGQDGKTSLPKMFTRNLPPDIMQQVIVELKEEYGFIQIAKKGQPLLQGATHLVEAPIRTLFAVIKEAHVVLCIDSFVQHAAAALGKKAIVLWGATNPACLGYACHNNLYRLACETPLCGRPSSFLYDTEPDGTPWQCPFGEVCTNHDQQNIIDAIREY